MIPIPIKKATITRPVPSHGLVSRAWNLAVGYMYLTNNPLLSNPRTGILFSLVLYHLTTNV